MTEKPMSFIDQVKRGWNGTEMVASKLTGNNSCPPWVEWIVWELRHDTFAAMWNFGWVILSAIVIAAMIPIIFFGVIHLTCPLDSPGVFPTHLKFSCY